MREVRPRYQTTITMTNVAIDDEQDILKKPANHFESARKSDFPDSTRKQKRDYGLASPSEIKAKVSLCALVARDGHKLKQSGKTLKCLCPFHDERTPSFVISSDDLAATCYGCGWHGDIFDYEMKKRKVGFFQAMQNLERKAGKVSRETPLDLTARPKVKEELTQQQHEIMKAAALRLASEARLWHFVAKARGWNDETILQLANEGVLGMYSDALAFNYATGMKLRMWPYRPFYWEFGGNGLWRGERIKEAAHIYITEGESDCISLVNARVEDEAGCAVVGCPGASGFKKEWGTMFKGKTVTLCFDNDEAGRRGANEVGTILQDYACAVNIHELKEVA